MNAVAYAKKTSVIPRYTDVSLKEQNDRIRKYASSKGWKLVGFYDDRSDDPEVDTGFKKLEADGINRCFDIVIIDSIYRFGKNVSYARELLQNVFYPAGIHFVVLEDDICSIDMTRNEIADYFFGVRQRANTINGKDKVKTHLSLTGEILPDKECYGYLLSDNRMEFIVDEEAASIIRLIFEMHLAGKKTGEICKYLNTKSIDTPAVHLNKVGIGKPGCKSNLWHHGHIQKIRKNVHLTGTTEDIGYRFVEYPQIIDKDTFDKVNAMCIGRSHGKKNTSDLNFENAFYRKAFFGSERMSCCYFEDEGLFYFCKRNTNQKILPYSDVEKAVRLRLIEERELCEKTLKVIETNVGINAIEIVESGYSSRLRVLTDELNEVITNKITLYVYHELGKISDDKYTAALNKANNDIRILDDNIQSLMDEYSEKIKAISEKNPWIRRYIGFDQDMTFSIKSMKPLIKKILVSEDRAISIDLFDEEKYSFPWLKQ